MATIAEQLLGIASQTAQNAPDIAGGFAKGAALAQSAERIQTERMKLQQAKAQNDLGKYAKIMDAVKVADKTKDPGIQNAILGKGGTVEKMVYALKADDVFTPETIALLNKSPEARANIVGYQAEMEKKIAGGMSFQQARAEVAATLPDTLSVASLDTGRGLKAQETYAAEVQHNNRQHEAAQAQLGKQIQAQNAAPVVEENKKLRADNLKFTNMGGQSHAEAQLKKLDESVAYFKDQLDQAKNSTGGVLTTLANKVGILGLKDPKLKIAMDNLKSSINLKESLDSQFSQSEAQQQYAMRTADVQLPVQDNYDRAVAMRDEARNAYNNRVSAFKDAGLKVSPGKAPPPPITDALKAGYKALSPDEQKKFIDSWTKEYGAKPEGL